MSETSFLIASKGLEKKTFYTMSEILKEELNTESKISVLSGPNLASEIIEGMAAACVIAAKNKKIGKEFLNIFDRQSFKVFLNNDVSKIQGLDNIYRFISFYIGIRRSTFYWCIYSKNPKPDLLVFLQGLVASFWNMFGIL